MRTLFTLTVFFLISACASNPYVDPSKSEPHAVLTVENRKGPLKSDIITQEINGFSTNHPGRWSLKSFRLKPGNNVIFVRVMGDGNVHGMTFIEIVAEEGEEYRMFSENKTKEFEVKIVDGENEVVASTSAEKEIYERSSGNAIPVFIPSN